MSTPLQLIKEGILTKNFQLISQGYTTLTGEILKILPDEKSVEVNKTQMFKSSRQDGFNEEDFHMQIVDKNRRQENDEGIEARTEPINITKIKTVGNLFKDAMDIAQSDINFDRKVHIKVPVQRTREMNQEKRKYKCECGKVDELSPIHVPTGRYVCPKCTKKKMKRG